MILPVSDEEGNTEESECGRRQISSVYSTLDSPENANFYVDGVISNQPAADIGCLEFNKLAIGNDKDSSIKSDWKINI